MCVIDKYMMNNIFIMARHFEVHLRRGNETELFRRASRTFVKSNRLLPLGQVILETCNSK